MIICRNPQRYIGLDFETYRQLPGYSFSFLKREVNGICAPVKKTVKMEAGTMVDNILTDGVVDMTDKMYPAAKKIAHVLRQKFGNVIKACDKQVSYTAVFEFDGFSMPVKGRPDFELPKVLIIDLKITHTRKVEETINFMQYRDQVWGYGKMAGVKDAYIMIYSTVTDEVTIVHVPIVESNGFWGAKVLRFGSVVKTSAA